MDKNTIDTYGVYYKVMFKDPAYTATLDYFDVYGGAPSFTVTVVDVLLNCSDPPTPFLSLDCDLSNKECLEVDF